MTSYNRRMRRALERGKKPHQVTYKVPCSGGRAAYDRSDQTKYGAIEKLSHGGAKVFNPFSREGGAI